jgi:hypothetical protein
MPVGKALAVGRDSRGNVVAIGAPVVLTSASRVEVTVSELPRTAVVVLRLPASVQPDAIGLTLAANEEKPRVPDVYAFGSDRAIAVWYRLPPGRAALHFTSDRLFLPDENVTVDGRKLVALERDVRPRPNLTVAIRIPSDSGVSSMSVTTTPQGEQRPERVVTIAGSGSITIDRVRPAVQNVALKLNDWVFHRVADLSDGRDGEVEFDIHPFTVTGMVRTGGKPMPATVAFSGDRLYETGTDDEGRYEIRLWHQRRYGVVVKPRDVSAVAPFLDTLTVDRDTEFNIDVPSTHLSVLVVDSKTGQGIDGAVVTVTNDWVDPTGDHRRVMSHVTADKDGIAYLPPSRDGNIQLRADAAGHKPGELHAVVDAATSSAPLKIPLDPLADTTALSLELPNGAPAVGADVVVVGANGAIAYVAKSGADGRVDLPSEYLGALLIARHPAAGSDARLWVTLSEEQQWRLPAPGPPLFLQAVDSSGARASSAVVYLLTPCCRIGGVALTYFASSSSLCTPDGRWVGYGLPAQAIRVLLTDGRNASAVNSGAFDALATTVRYPWTDVQRIVKY